MNRVLALSSILLAACDQPPLNTEPDARVTPMGDAFAQGPTALVVSGIAGESGIMSSLDVNTLTVRENISPAGGVGGDPLVRHIGDRIFVINRFGNNAISIYDAHTLMFVDQIGTGPGSNPQDVAVVGNFMYAATAGTGGAVKVSLDKGVVTPLDVSVAVGDPDGVPDCVSAYAVGDKVYISCGVFDENFSPRSNGKIAIIDTANNDAVTAITLPSTNPQGFIVQSPASSMFGGDLLVPTTPSYTDYSTGCLARVSTGATPTATCAEGLSNADMCGLIAHADIAPNGVMMWLAITTLDSSFMNPTGTLRAFDLTEGTMWPATSPTTQLIVDTAVCPDNTTVVVLDRKKDTAGIRVYKDNTEVTTVPLAFGLPPLFGNNTLCYDPSAP